MISEVILLGVTLYLLYKWLMPEVPKNFPPGPKNYPLIGGAYSIPKLDPVTAVALIKLGERYDPKTTGMYFGKDLGIIVNGFETIKEVLSREEFNGRPKFVDDFANCIPEAVKEKGIMFNEGESWEEQRRFSLRVLRDLGFGKSSFEGVIHDEIRECFQIISKTLENSSHDVGVPVIDMFTCSITNILWHVMSGKRFKHDDAEFQDILVSLKEALRTPNPISSVVFAYPWLRHFLFFKGIFDKQAGATLELQKLFRKTIAECEKHETFEVDFMHEYLKELTNLKEKGSGSTGSFSRDQLIAVSTDLFSAGSETTSNSIVFGVLYMLHYPVVQRKVHEELNRVVGKDQLPSLSHKPELIYMEAVLNELFRCATVAPLTIPHATIVDTTLNGYDIPKGTTLHLNLHSINMEKSYWGDPENFRPERFIDNNGKLIKYDQLQPFGSGRRVCPGESLARMNLYLFFTAFMQAFQVEPVPNEELPTLIPVPGFTVAPAPFNAILIPRK